MVVELRRRVGCRDRGRIVQGVLADEALVGLVEFALGLHDQEKVVGGVRNDPVRHGPRHHDVIAAFKPQRSEIGLDGPLAPVHENQFVAVRVAKVKRHRRRAARHVQPYVLVAQERHRQTLRVAQVRGFQPVQIEAVRPQFPFEPDPAGGWMSVVKVRALAVKAFTPVFFFEGSFRKSHVGLCGDLALFQRIHSPSCLI